MATPEQSPSSRPETERDAQEETQIAEPSGTKELEQAGDETAEFQVTKPKPTGTSKAETASTHKGAAGTGESAKKKVSRLGDFKLSRKLGQGGMGTVYLARQANLDRSVAIKTLSKQLAKNPSAVQRFLREARSMAKLQHPNIVQVYAADSQSGFHYVALEYIDGKSMQDWMNALKRLSLADALHVTLIAADALKHAHGQNMIHRDVKPDNILVTKSGIVKVSDFGLAKAVDEDVSVTQSGTGLGTPLYMPPEQARNAKHVDHRSDIYALGCTLYYFLTGELPFKGESALEIITAKETGQFLSARRLNPEIPERLDLMIDKMLSRELAHRYGGCDQLIRDLQSLDAAGMTLSFIDGGLGAGDLPAASTSVLAPTRSVSSSLSQPSSSVRPASVKRTERQRATAETAVDEEAEWYVSFKTPDGKLHLKQLSTAQVVKAIKGGRLDAQAKAKRHKDDKMLPLAQFPEFVQHIEKLLVRQRSQKKQSRLQEMFAEVERYEKRKRIFRWLKRMTESTLGWITLLVWLGVIVGVGVGLYYLIPIVPNSIADYFNLR